MWTRDGKIFVKRENRDTFVSQIVFAEYKDWVGPAWETALYKY